MSAGAFWDYIDAQHAKTRPVPATAPGPGGPLDAGDLTHYLTVVCHNAATAANGTRNAKLNAAAYTLGRIIGAGQLDETVATDALTDAGHAAGLEDDEIPATIASGLTAGKNNPRQLAPGWTVPEVTSWLDSYVPSDSTTGSTPPPAPPRNADDAAPAEPGGDPPDLTAIVHQHLPLLDWHDLWADETEEEWIIEPLLPARRLIALYSAPKVGKSLLVLELAAAIATGQPVLGITPTRPYRVLYVDFENDPKADIRERLQAMGYHPDDLERLCYLSFPTLAALDGEKGSRELLAAVQVYACEVVIIDTLSRAVTGEENENDTWLDFYRHTGLKLKQAQVALIRLDHSGKNDERGMRGGSAKSGDVDAVWRLSTVVPDHTYRLDCEANRMPVTEKTVVLHRETLPHLHHRVDAHGRQAAWDAETEAAIAILDSLNVDTDLGRVKVRELLKAGGHRVGNVAMGAAIKARRDRIPAYEMPGLTLRGALDPEQDQPPLRGAPGAVTPDE